MAKTNGETVQSEQSLQEELLRLKKELEMQLTALKAQPAKSKSKPTISGAWEEKRTIFLPRGAAKEQNYVLVGVNGRRYQVPRGKQVEVPLPLYERLVIMQEAEDRAYELRQKVIKQSEENASIRRVT